MLSPGITYQYAQAKDVAGGTLQIVNKKTVLVNTTDVLVSTLIIVPADKVFVLSAMQAYAKSQTTGEILALAVSVIFENSSHPVIYQEPEGDPTQWLTENWTGEIWIPPSSSIEASATFDNDVDTHVLRFSIHGVLIPRGNVQQG